MEIDQEGDTIPGSLPDDHREEISDKYTYIRMHVHTYIRMNIRIISLSQ